ncbi:transforming growth factor-beta receptor-associated protein 1-like [Watersipora subatra]|uniref:transforming growth factor-beta receptor-associated protein 1-like n=1 Tax=Watersipora subatra TaxID=2589382 RepID=UPI00355BF277
MSTKAFELVSVLERHTLLSDIKSGQQSSAEISCLDCCTKNIFIGSTNGLVVHYTVDEKRSGEKTAYRTHLQGKRHVAKKAIQQLSYIPCLDKAILLIDGVVCVFDTVKCDLSSSHDRLRNVHSFSVDMQRDNANPFSRQICFASRKKQLQLYNLSADKWIHIKDISLPELPLITCLDSNKLCLALQTKYMLVNTETSKMLDLFPYNRETDSPFVKRLEKGEFFLGGPSDLGMFVSASGVSKRPPMQLKNETFALAFSSPYLISLNHEFIVIHNTLDQQQKQAIKFQRGIKLQELSDRVLVSSGQDIYALVPVPWQKQVEGLLEDEKVDEALSLAESSSRISGLSSSQFRELYSVLLRKAGFIEFSLYNFEKAQRYFTEGNVDLREVISLFPSLLSASSNFTRSRPPLHTFADIKQITKGDLEKLELCKAWLVRYLEAGHPRTQEKKDVHTALMKVYSENCPADLIQLLQKNYQGYPVDTVEALQLHKRFHALAIYYQRNSEVDKALNLWSRLLNKELRDESFDTLGLPYFADVLSKMSNADHVLTYAPTVLELDPLVGAQIFTKIFASDVKHPDKKLKPEAVIDFLVRFPKALTSYLEYLVNDADQQKEAFHTHLSMVYLDQLFEARHNNKMEEVKIIRKKLQEFLSSSTKYSVTLILGRVERDDWLLPEAAILYGKAGNDKAALDILVNRLGDYNAAKQYCVQQSASKSTAAERQQLFEILLNLYLEKTKSDEQMRVSVIDLLNSPHASFNAAKVAEVIPEDWSIALLSKFMLNTVRASLHNGRQASICSQLAYHNYFLAKKDYLSLRSTNISITDSRRCEVCHQKFKDSAFVRLPNGNVVHPKCNN